MNKTPVTYASRATATVPSLASNSTSFGQLPSAPLLGPVSQYLSSTLTTTDPIPTEAGILGLPAAWRAASLVANGVAVMMTGADVVNRAGVEQPLPLLVESPNLLYGTYEFWFEAMLTAQIHGNAVFIKTDFDDEGYPTQVIPVHPYNVDCRIAQNGYPVYKIGDDYYRWSDVIHVRGITVPGQWWGIGVIEAMRKTIVGSIDMQNYLHNTFRTGAFPAVALKLNTAGRSGSIPQQTIDDVAAQFLSAHGSGQRKVFVHSGDIELNTKLGMSPVDVEFLANRVQNIAEIAYAFGLDPSDLSSNLGAGAGSSMTYANIEQRNIERISSSYGPWLRRFEDAWTRALPQGQYVKGNPEALLRTDTMTRLAAYEKGLAMGLHTAEFAQDKENIPQTYRPLKEAA